MIDKINDIKRAIEAKAYLSALALALTIPDICGKLAHPAISQIRERYAKWFDDYVFPFYGPPKKEYPQFTGEICYKLRCAFLHAGNTEGIPIDQFDLCMDGCSCFGSTWRIDSDKKQHIRINIEEFCLAVCNAVEQFHNQNIGNFDFSDAHITIINIRNECEKIEKLNSYQK